MSFRRSSAKKTEARKNLPFGGVYCGPASDILNPPPSPPKIERTSSLRKSLRESFRRTKEALTPKGSRELAAEPTSPSAVAATTPPPLPSTSQQLSLTAATPSDVSDAQESAEVLPSTEIVVAAPEAITAHSAEQTTITKQIATPIKPEPVDSAQQHATVSDKRGGSLRERLTSTLSTQKMRLRSGAAHTSATRRFPLAVTVHTSLSAGRVAWVAPYSYYCLFVAGKTKCEICKKKCAGDILKADDKFFHIGCFTCKSELRLFMLPYLFWPILAPSPYSCPIIMV